MPPRHPDAPALNTQHADNDYIGGHAAGRATAPPKPPHPLGAAQRAATVSPLDVLHTPQGVPDHPATPGSFWPPGGSATNPLLAGALPTPLRSRLPLQQPQHLAAAAAVLPPHTKRPADAALHEHSKRARTAVDGSKTPHSSGSTRSPARPQPSNPTLIDPSLGGSWQLRPSQYWTALPPSQQQRLTTYLPEELAAHYLPASVNGGMLYEWQVRRRPVELPWQTHLGTQASCLVMPGVLAGRNLVYSVPTGAGKTLVAEVLLLRRMIERQQRDCGGVAGMIVLPFNAVCREKVGVLYCFLYWACTVPWYYVDLRLVHRRMRLSSCCRVCPACGTGTWHAASVPRGGAAPLVQPPFLSAPWSVPTAWLIAGWRRGSCTSSAAWWLMSCTWCVFLGVDYAD